MSVSLHFSSPLGGVRILVRAARTTLASLALLLFAGSAAAVPPVVTSVSPDSGYDNIDFAVTGTDFGSTPGTLTVDGRICTVVNWADTQIDAVVPYCATTGPVVVTTGSGPSNSDKLFKVVFASGYTDAGPYAFEFLNSVQYNRNNGKLYVADRDSQLGVVVEIEETASTTGPEPTVRTGRKIGTLHMAIGTAIDDAGCVYYSNNWADLGNVGTVRRACPPFTSQIDWGRASRFGEWRRSTRIARKQNQSPFYVYFNDAATQAIMEVHPFPELSVELFFSPFTFSGVGSGLTFGKPASNPNSEVFFWSAHHQASNTGRLIRRNCVTGCPTVGVMTTGLGPLPGGVALNACETHLLAASRIDDKVIQRDLSITPPSNPTHLVVAAGVDDPRDVTIGHDDHPIPTGTCDQKVLYVVEQNRILKYRFVDPAGDACDCLAVRNYLTEEQSEYEAPGLDPEHLLDQAHPFEAIDLFTGGLFLSYTDMSFPGNGGLDLAIRRAYSSKVVVDQDFSIEPSSYGLGWTMHQGRLHVGSSFKTLEVPGIRKQEFRASKTDPTKSVSQDFWRLDLQTILGVDNWVATTPTGIQYRFPDTAAQRMNPFDAFLYVDKIVDSHGNEISVTYSTLYAADNWPYIDVIRDSIGREVRFIYDDDPAWDTDHPDYPRPLTTVRSKDSNGADVEVLYTVAFPSGGACHTVLGAVKATSGDTTTYDYGEIAADRRQPELKSILLPTGGELRYVYDDHDFQGPGGIVSARVVTTREVQFNDNFGSNQVQTWSYVYPLGSDTDNLTIKTSANGHKSEYAHLNYGTLGTNPVWSVGLPKSQLYRQGTGTPLKSAEQIYDPYPFAADGTSVALIRERRMSLLAGSAKHSRKVFTYACVGPSCTTSYDDYGNPTRVDAYEYDGSNPSTRLGRVERFTYNHLVAQNIVGLPASYKLEDGAGTVVRDEGYVYSPSGNLDTATLSYETRGLGTGGGSATIGYRYDGNGNAIRRESSRAPGTPYIENFEYANGVVSRLYYNDSASTLDLRRTTDFNTGLVMSETDRNGQTTRFEYDRANRLLRTTPAAGDTVEHTYDPGGVSMLMTSGTSSTRYRYDGMGRVGSVAVKLDGGQLSWQKRAYDSEGNALQVFEPAFAEQGLSSPGVATTYDGVGRATQVTVAGTGGGPINMSYDGNSVTSTGTLPGSRRETFSAFGQMTEVVDEASNITRYTYDVSGLLTTVEHVASGQVRQDKYSRLGHRIQENAPETGITGYELDEVGNVIRRRDANGQETTYKYDYKNRLVLVTYTGSSLAPIMYEYDSPATVNGLNRITRISGPDGGDVRYLRYDPQGRVEHRTELVLGTTLETLYSYNSQGMVASMAFPFAGGAPRAKVGYTYNDANLVTSVDLLTSAGFRRVVNSITYKADFRQKNVTFNFGGLSFNRDGGPSDRNRHTRINAVGSPNFNGDYGYSYFADLISAFTVNGRSDVPSYDLLGRLTSLQYGSGPNDRIDYIFDPVGNLLRRTSPNLAWMARPGFRILVSVNSLNQISSGGFFYNARGELIRDASGNNYAYTRDGQLVNVQPPGSGLPAAWSFNGLGDRVLRGSGPPPPALLTGGPGPDELAPFDPDRSELLVSAPEEVFLHDEAGDVMSLFGVASLAGMTPRMDFLRVNDQTLLSIEYDGSASGAERYQLAYLNDVVGSPRTVYMKDGKALVEAEWFPDGYVKEVIPRLSPLPSPVPQIRVGFQGKILDLGTAFGSPGLPQLTYFGSRVLNTNTGRFLQSDPSRQSFLVAAPHSLNGYALSWNNPQRYTDPDGRIVWDVLDAFSFGWSIGTFIREPSWANAADVGFNTLGLLPIIPSPTSVKLGKKAVRALDRFDDVNDTRRGVGRISSAGGGGGKPPVNIKDELQKIADKVSSAHPGPSSAQRGNRIHRDFEVEARQVWGGRIDGREVLHEVSVNSKGEVVDLFTSGSIRPDVIVLKPGVPRPKIGDNIAGAVEAVFDLKTKNAKIANSWAQKVRARLGVIPQEIREP